MYLFIFNKHMFVNKTEEARADSPVAPFTDFDANMDK